MAKKVDIEQEDLYKLLLFIISMFQQENNHRQGTSSKNDFIGGYIDRWINKLSEDLIFNKGLLVNKNYSVVNDYFIYGAESEKNAPDVLGLRQNDKIIPFAKFNKNKWEMIDGMPHIEVKTFRKNQRMASVRETQLDDDNYYMFVESELESDYLINFLKKKCFNKKIYKSIEMDSCFIKNNENEILKKVQNINKNKDDILGQLKLITIISGKDYRERSVRCIEKESVYYIKNIVEVSNIRSQLHKAISFRDMFNYNSKINVYEGTWNDHKLISFYADRVDKIKIKKTNKKNFYCISKQDFCLNGQELHKDKIYKVEFEEFQRSSNWIEYIAMKNQFPDSVDKTKKLVDLFDKIIEKN